MAILSDRWWKPQSISIARLDPATDEPDVTSFTKFEIKGTNMDIEEHHIIPTKLSSGDITISGEIHDISPETRRALDRLVRNSSAIAAMARQYREWKDVGYKRGIYRVSYSIYAFLQREARRVYGCNLKRAMRMYGIKARVRHQTRNGYWVWMK